MQVSDQWRISLRVILGAMLTLMLAGCQDWDLGDVCDEVEDHLEPPTVDKFVLKYDVLTTADTTQEACWETEDADWVRIKVKDSDGTTVHEEEFVSPFEDFETINTGALKPGEYDVEIIPEENEEEAKSMKMRVVSNDEWIDSEEESVTVDSDGFDDAAVEVAEGQDYDNRNEVLSVSPTVEFSHVRWNGTSTWPVCDDSQQMTVQKDSHAETLQMLPAEYPFPSDWNPSAPSGTYYCSVHTGSDGESEGCDFDEEESFVLSFKVSYEGQAQNEAQVQAKGQAEDIAQAKAEDDAKDGVRKKLEVRPEGNAGHKPSVKPRPRPSVKPRPRPSVKPNDKPSGKPGPRPSIKPNHKPSGKPGPRPSIKRHRKPSGRTQVKPGHKPAEAHASPLRRKTPVEAGSR